MPSLREPAWRVTGTGATVRTLPMLVIPLRGEGVKLSLRGKTALSPSRPSG